MRIRMVAGVLLLVAVCPVAAADPMERVLAAMGTFQYDQVITNLMLIPAEGRPVEAWHRLAMAHTQRSQVAAGRMDAAAERRDLEAAQSAVLEGLCRFPDDPELLARRGALACRLAQGQGASAVLVGLNKLLLDSEAALRLSPTNAVACAVAGETQLTLAGMPWWQRTLVLPNLATEWGRHPTAARAAELLGRAVKAAPDVIHLRLGYGKALAADGQAEKAREQWTHALGMQPLLRTDIQAQAEARRLLEPAAR